MRAVVCIVLASLFSIWCQQRADISKIGAVSEPDTAASDLTPSVAKIRLNSDLVVVPVTVIDGQGRAVNGLLKESFTLYEDNVEQLITQFSSEDSPVSIGIVFDTSDSMSPKLQKARESVAALLDSSNSEDEFFLVQFNDRAQLLVSPTKQTDEIRKQVEMLRASGSTALLDAVMVALNEMRTARYSRKAIIIISDGEDNASHCSVRDVKDAVRAEDVLVYSIGIGDSGASSPGLTGSALLSDLTKDTGGRLFEVRRLKQLPEISSRISAWLRKQYVLAYSPNKTESNARYRHIQVRIAKPTGFPRLHAFWRLGYYAPAE